VKPSTLVEVRGVRVGLIGVTTPDTPALTIGANVIGLTFAPLVPVITREAMALRARGATAVIVLAHAGGRCTRLDDPENLSSCDQMAEIVQVARRERSPANASFRRRTCADVKILRHIPAIRLPLAQRPWFPPATRIALCAPMPRPRRRSLRQREKQLP
jgi:hypothetical protein